VDVDRSVRRLPIEPDEVAPDGAEVRLLARTENASMAHFRVHPGQVTHAVMHRSIDEIWYVTTGEGEIWMSNTGAVAPHQVALRPGLSLAIPQGTAFQCKNAGRVDLDIIAVQVPPWPGDDEAGIVDSIFDAD